MTTIDDDGRRQYIYEQGSIEMVGTLLLLRIPPAAGGGAPLRCWWLLCWVALPPPCWLPADRLFGWRKGGGRIITLLYCTFLRLMLAGRRRLVVVDKRRRANEGRLLPAPAVLLANYYPKSSLIWRCLPTIPLLVVVGGARRGQQASRRRRQTTDENDARRPSDQQFRLLSTTTYGYRNT